MQKNMIFNSNIKIEKIAIKPEGSQTIYAKGNNFTIAENVEVNNENGKISIDGGDNSNTIKIKSGKWNNIISGNTNKKDEYNIIYIEGGIIENILATNKDIETYGNINIIIEGGTVQTISTGEANIKGNLGILIINSENQIKVENQENVNGKYELSNYKDNKDTLGNVYFVKDGAKGDGTKPSNEVSNINEAINKLENRTGTIVISGELTVQNSTVLSEYKNITITSVYKSIDYRKTNEAQIRLDKGIRLNGETTIKDINLVATSDSSYIVCAGNKTIFDSGINSEVYKNRGVKDYTSIIGGYRNPTSTINKNTNITIKSGTWGAIYGGNNCTYNKEDKQTKKITTDFNNDITLKIQGGTFKDKILVGNMGNMIGDINLDIDDGEFDCSIYAIPFSTTCFTESSIMSGNININIKNGKFYGNINAKQINNDGEIIKYNDNEGLYKYILNLEGGDFSRVNEIRGLTDGKDEIKISSNINLDEKIEKEIEYTNPIIESKADPFVKKIDNYYYYVYSQAYNGRVGIAIKRALNLCDIKNSEPIQIWYDTSDDSNIEDLWAPTLYKFEENGKEEIYIYSILRRKNEEGEVIGVPIILKCKDSTNPLGKYENLGAMKYGYKENNKKVIISNIGSNQENITDNINTWLSPRFLEYHGKIYLICGGMTKEDVTAINNRTLIEPKTGYPFIQTQVIMLAEMLDPTTINIDNISTQNENKIEIKIPIIMEATKEWEMEIKNGNTVSAVIEGAFPIVKDDEIYLAYSANGTYGNSYCTGLLKYIGETEEELTNASKWLKFENPIHQSNTKDKIISTGAMIFVQENNSNEMIAVYHAKKFYNVGWRRRNINMQKATFVEEKVNLYSTIRSKEDTIVEKEVNTNTITFLKSDNTTFTNMPENVDEVYTIKANDLPLKYRILDFEINTTPPIIEPTEPITPSKPSTEDKNTNKQPENNQEEQNKGEKEQQNINKGNEQKEDLARIPIPNAGKISIIIAIIIGSAISCIFYYKYKKIKI